MSWIALALISFTLIIIISQFGKRLAAKNAIIWWSVGIFIIFVAVAPNLIKPVIELLGIKLVSNFLLAGLIMFLFLQVLELTAESTGNSRKMRSLVSSLAANSYLEKNSDLLLIHESKKLKVVVILPSFNEEDAIPTTLSQLSKVLNSLQKTREYFICFVDDGSSDRSAELLQSLCPKLHTTHMVNIGVSGAMLTGFSIARKLNADYVVQFDADGQHPANQIDSLVSHALETELDMVVGSRFLGNQIRREKNPSESTTKLRIFGISVIRQMLLVFGSKARIEDPTSGFRVYSKRAQSFLLQQMPDEYPEPESIALLAMAGMRLGEFPVEMEARSTGVSSISGFKTVRFMTKVLTALIGLRLRSIIVNFRRV